MDNKRLLIAAVLSMAVLFLWQILFPPPEPVAPVRPSAPVVAAAETSPAAPTPGLTPGPAGAPPEAAAAVPEQPATEPPIEATDERREVLENEALRAEFTNRGARLVSLRVKGVNVEVGKAGTPPGDLELVAPRRESPLPFSLVGAGGEALPVNAALFVTSRDSSAKGERLTFSYRRGEWEVSKSFVLASDG